MSKYLIEGIKTRDDMAAWFTDHQIPCVAREVFNSVDGPKIQLAIPEECRDIVQGHMMRLCAVGIFFEVKLIRGVRVIARDKYFHWMGSV